MARSCTWINTFALVSLIVLTSACEERYAGAGSSAWGYSQPQPNAALQSFVDGKALDAAMAGPEIPAAERTRLVDQVRRIYKDQNYQLIWLDGDRPSERYRQFAKALDAADAHGLPRARYTMPIRGFVRGAGTAGGRTNHRDLLSILHASRRRPARPARPSVAVDLETGAAGPRCRAFGCGEKQRPHRSDGKTSAPASRISRASKGAGALSRDRCERGLAVCSAQYAAQAASAIRDRPDTAGSGWRSKAIWIRHTKKIQVPFSTRPSPTR